MSAPASAQSSGIVGTLRALGDGLLTGVRDRVALFAIEIQEEKLRLIQTLLWIGGAMIAIALALLFASALLIYLFWESARGAVLVGLAAFYVAAALGLVTGLLGFLLRQPRPFAATLEELETDRQCIRGDS